SATASSRNSSSSAASPCAWTHASKCWRVVVIPASLGSTRCASAAPAPFFACVRCALSVLFVIGGSLAPVLGTVCLGRRDSHADQGAVATQFSSSTGAGTSPRQGQMLVVLGDERLVLSAPRAAPYRHACVALYQIDGTKPLTQTLASTTPHNPAPAPIVLG